MVRTIVSLQHLNGRHQEHRIDTGAREESGFITHDGDEMRFVWICACDKVDLLHVMECPHGHSSNASEVKWRS